MNRDVVIHYEVDQVWVETGRKIPKNQCECCGRADWVDESLTVEEAIAAGFLEPSS